MTEQTRTVIVTGAGGNGCGRSIAARFASTGAAVIVADMDEAGGHRTVDLIKDSGGRAAFFRVDVRDEHQVKAMVAFAELQFGNLHVLVNNASAPHGDSALESWTDPIQTDLLGALYATRYAVEAMRRTGYGAIVNVASISAMWHGRTTPGGIPPYDVAKAAMIRMTTRLASLAASDRIRVNCLAPGWIATEQVRVYWESVSEAERAAQGIPSRLLTTDEIADVVMRLADDDSYAGRVVVWWSESSPRLVAWGDRGYEHFVDF